MSNPPPSDVLGALPRTRPHRRSDKRAAKPAVTASDGGSAEAVPTPATPAAATKRAASKQAAPKQAAPKQAAPKQAAPKQAAPKQAAAAKAGTGARPKLVAVPSRDESGQARATPFYTPAGSPGRVAAQKAAKPAPSDEKVDILGTAVQAAAELAEIGISATARAIRGAVARLPRP